MKKHVIVKICIILILLLLAIRAYNLIDNWAVWQDVPEDLIEIEDVNRINKKEIYAYVLASIPFVTLLVLIILILNSLRRDFTCKK
jgi:TRAP-type C4-dicarboxylate transport system permease small subunit